MKVRAPKACHTHFTMGKRLRVVMRDGNVIEDHFIERTSRHVVLRSSGRILVADIRSMSIARGKA